MAELFESEDDEVSEVESFVLGDDLDDDDREPSLQVDPETRALLEAAGIRLGEGSHEVDDESKARLETLLEAAGLGKHIVDPDVLRRLTSSVSCALDEAAAALTRMRNESTQQPQHNGSSQSSTRTKNHVQEQLDLDGSTLVDACTDGDLEAVRRLLQGGGNANELTEEGESLLSLACSSGYLELAQLLLTTKANVEDRGLKDTTPLMEAASAGHLDIVKLLLNHGADVNAQTSQGNTPLMYACAGGYEQVVELLLKSGANVEDHNENGHTPLMEAASAGHVAVARILVQHGASINTHSNEFKESALTLACYKGHLEMVRFLLEAGADQEHKTEEMHTALMEASMDGHVEVARLLLDSGAQVNMPADSFESPLTLAACGGHVELALLLLERGANIEEVNDEGYTPLMEAAREGHEEMVALLLSQGADINAQTEETQETALTLACCGGFLEVADFLIKAGADIEAGANTPLMEAAQEGHMELVRHLLGCGSNINATTASGDTSLMYACENGHTDVAEILLDTGANLEHEAEGGRTPLMKAARAGHLCTVQFLVSKGANINKVTSNNDHTPLSLACAGGHMSVVEYLLIHGADPTHRLKDNSTMLIEAAKGGHTQVVQLLIEYPNRASSPQIGDLPCVPCDTTVGLPQPLVPPPRVPPHGQEPFETSSRKSSISTSVKHIKAARKLKTGDVEPYVPQPKSRPAKGQLERALSDGGTGPPVALVPDMSVTTSGAATLKETERLEQCINNMMKRTEMLNPSREEQILQKQQILEELQRVEKELQEKAQAQIMLAVQQKQNLAQQNVLEHFAALGIKDAVEAEDKVSNVQVTEGKDTLSVASTTEPKARPPSPVSGANRKTKSKIKAAKLQQHQQQANLVNDVEKMNLKNVADSKQGANVGTTSGASSWTPMAAQLTGGSTMAPQFMAPELAQNIASASLQRETLQSFIQQGLSLLNDPNFTNAASNQSTQTMVGGHQQPNQITTQQLTTQSTQTMPLGSVVTNEQSSAVSVPSPSAIKAPANVLPALTSQQLQVLKSQLAAAAAVVSSGTGVDLPLRADPPPCAQNYQLGAPAFPINLNLAQVDQQLYYQQSTSLTFDSSNTGQYVTTEDVSSTCFETFGSGVPVFSSDVSQMNPVAFTGLQANSVVNVNDVLLSSLLPPGEASLPNDEASEGPPVATVICSSSSSSVATTVSTTTNTTSSSVPSPPPWFPPVDLDSQTDSNHDTALTLACAGGHEELVQLLLNRGSNIEHRDKKGFTPLMLASTAGHANVCEVLLNAGADIEAQSERTKDTALSLGCSSGRYEVVELLLSRGANKEHRNVSDYTPLSLAASGGYVNIIKLLLNAGAEINSRTGSKLGISPLMLAAMNGHASTVKLLLDMGSDINAQIETNRNTALTLACFQGRCEVVGLLLDRKANVEHRAKTGLTPLMEAASGGYVEVGRILLDKGADVNALPVPSSRDTALTIAADKGHYRFVELLIRRGAQVDVKNKKGSSPLWLACNGGHLDVVQLLVTSGADIDSQDNRKVSCIMAAFRKGHLKVVKWMVKHVTQFPSDQEMSRYIALISDGELLKKCQQCVEIIKLAKEKQAAEANKNATILLEEIDMERSKEEVRKQAAAVRREKRKARKKEKQEEKTVARGSRKGNDKVRKKGKKESDSESDSDADSDDEATSQHAAIDSVPVIINDKTSSSNSSSARSSQSPAKEVKKQPVAVSIKVDQVKKIEPVAVPVTTNNRSKKLKKAETILPETKGDNNHTMEFGKHSNSKLKDQIEKEKVEASEPPRVPAMTVVPANIPERREPVPKRQQMSAIHEKLSNESAMRDSNGIDTRAKHTNNGSYSSKSTSSAGNAANSSFSVVGKKAPLPSKSQETGWKEVTRRSKKVSVPASAISRVIGRGGCNINAVREISGAHIEVEKQRGQQGDRQIIIKGSADATKHAQQLINALANEPDKELAEIVAELGLSRPNSSSGDEYVAPAARIVKPIAVNPVAPSSPLVNSKTQAGNMSKSVAGALPAAFFNRSPGASARGPVAASAAFSATTWIPPKTVVSRSSTEQTLTNSTAILSSTSIASGSRPRLPESSATTSTPTKSMIKTSSPDMKSPAPFGAGAVVKQPPAQQAFASRSPKPTPGGQGVASTTTSVQPTGPQQQADYTPFTNNLFSKVGSSVWGSKDAQKPNFASVAASGLTSQQQQLMFQQQLQHQHAIQQQQQNSSVTGSLTIQPQGVSNSELDLGMSDASKAPGYRGNFISPSLSSTPSSSMSSTYVTAGHRSAPCTPPLLVQNAMTSLRQASPPAASLSPPPMQQLRADYSHDQGMYNTSSFVSSPMKNNFNLAPGARYQTALSFSQQHGPLSSIAPIQPPLSSGIDSIGSSSQGLVQGQMGALNPNAPDFSRNDGQINQQHSNGPSLLRPALNMAQQQPNASRPAIPFQEVLPNPQLQMQMRAAILAAGASLQMQTLQAQQARYSQSIGAAQVQAAAAAAAAMGAPDFSPPSAETLRLLHTAISAFPASGNSSMQQSSTSSQAQSNSVAAPSMQQQQQQQQQQYPFIPPGLGRAEAKVEQSDDRRPSLRPIGGERAQKKHPFAGLNSGDLWPMDVAAGNEADWLNQQFADPSLMSSMPQGNFNSNRIFDHPMQMSVDQVFDQQYQQQAFAAPDLPYMNGINQQLPPNMGGHPASMFSAPSMNNHEAADYWTGKMPGLSNGMPDHNDPHKLMGRPVPGNVDPMAQGWTHQSSWNQHQA
ncbi:Ankyrin repeat and KH domain-containing protein 1 [Halotydeus destructor]|nr:Ankyrin repeat and KH domain-containing protein 1 [Halotydeus destructor]